MIGPRSPFELAACAAIFDSALQTGVFRHLLGGPEPPLDPHARALLDDALVAMDLAVRDETGITASPTLLQANRSPGGIEVLGMLWSLLPDLLRTGHTPLQDLQSGMFYRSSVKELGTMWAAPASLLADQLDEVDHIVDVGAGSGVWSLAMARRSATTRVTVLDLPEVVPRFLEAAADLGERAAAVPGDALTTPIPTADRIVFGNFLHLFEAAEARQLVHRAGRAAGEVVIIDALSDGGPADELTRACYALHLALRRPGSRVHRRQSLVDWAAEVGREPVADLTLGSTDTGLKALVLR